MVLDVPQEATRQSPVAACGLAGAQAWEVPDERLIDLAARAQTILGTTHCVINILDDLRQWSVSGSADVPLSVSARFDSVCQQVLSRTPSTQGLVVVPDAAADPSLADNIWVNGDAESIRFYACAPLMPVDGHALGAVCMWSEVPNVPSPSAGSELRAFADVVMEALERRRLEQPPAVPPIPARSQGTGRGMRATL